MNTYYLKRIRKRFSIEDHGRLWLLIDRKKKRESAYGSYGFAFYYMFEEYFGPFNFLSWIKKCRKRILSNLLRENKKLSNNLQRDNNVS